MVRVAQSYARLKQKEEMKMEILTAAQKSKFMYTLKLEAARGCEHSKLDGFYTVGLGHQGPTNGRLKIDITAGSIRFSQTGDKGDRITLELGGWETMQLVEIEVHLAKEVKRHRAEQKKREDYYKGALGYDVKWSEHRHWTQR